MIRKIGLVVQEDGRLLLVRKQGTHHLILPGGKPLHAESDVDCLVRELREELGVELKRDSLVFLAEFSGQAANENEELQLVAYRGGFVGHPHPKSEIAEVCWWRLGSNADLLSPILRDLVVPHLTD